MVGVHDLEVTWIKFYVRRHYTSWAHYSTSYVILLFKIFINLKQSKIYIISRTIARNVHCLAFIIIIFTKQQAKINKIFCFWLAKNIFHYEIEARVGNKCEQIIISQGVRVFAPICVLCGMQLKCALGWIMLLYTYMYLCYLAHASSLVCKKRGTKAGEIKSERKLKQVNVTYWKADRLRDTLFYNGIVI